MPQHPHRQSQSSRSGAPRRRRPAVQEHRARHSAASGPLATSLLGVTGLSLPILDGIPHELRSAATNRRAAAVAALMIQAGVLDWRTWTPATDAFDWLATSLQSICPQTPHLFFHLSIQLQDEGSPDWIFVEIVPTAAGHVELKPILQPLAKLDFRLASTFAHLFTDACRFGRAYNLFEATQHLEELREWQDEDPDYEVPQIPMPEDLTAIAKTKPLPLPQARQQLLNLPLATRRQWDLLLATRRLASDPMHFLLPAPVDDYLTDRGDCAPFLLAAWEKDDGITTCFDDLAQRLNELEFYPTWIGAFRLDDPQGAHQVFRQARRFITWQTAMDQLLEAMHAE